ncbi:MAG TPA: hypothetical protein VGL38_07460 [bacterium]|jgi:hypothetical protein
MDVKKVLSAKNVAVGSIVTVAAVLSSIQSIRDNVAKLWPHQTETAALQWNTLEDDRATGRLTLDFYWPGTKDADAPVVRSSRIEGARRVPDNDSVVFAVGQRLGRDKWPLALQRMRNGKVWQDVKITVQTDRAGVAQIYVPQEEVSSPPEAAATPPEKATPGRVPQRTTPEKSSPPPVQPGRRDTVIGSVQSTVEQAALKKLQEILTSGTKPQKIVALEAFIANPHYSGTAAQKQAEQELAQMLKR